MTAAPGIGPAAPSGGADPVGERLDQAAAAVAEARRRLERGDAGVTSPLAEQVDAALRDASPALAADTAGPLRARLVALLDEAGALVAAIERERAAAGMRLRELAVRGRAGHAYGAGR